MANRIFLPMLDDFTELQRALHLQDYIVLALLLLRYPAESSTSPVRSRV